MTHPYVIPSAKFLPRENLFISPTAYMWKIKPYEICSPLRARYDTEQLHYVLQGDILTRFACSIWHPLDKVREIRGHAPPFHEVGVTHIKPSALFDMTRNNYTTYIDLVSFQVSKIRENLPNGKICQVRLIRQCMQKYLQIYFYVI